MPKGKSNEGSIPESANFMYLSRLQIAEIFGISSATVGKRLGATPPAGRRNGGMVWHIKDVTELIDVRAQKRKEVEVSEDEEIINDPAKMNPSQRRMYYQAEDLKQASEIKARRNAVEAGQLLQASEVEKVLAQAFKTLALTLDTLPDLFERDGLVHTGDIERVIEIVDNSRVQIATDLSKLSDEVAEIEAQGEW